MTPADVLDAAADLIEKHGWWDGETDDEDAHCAITAVMTAAPLSAVLHHSDVRAFVWRRLRERVGESIADWNDASTADEVIETLRKCAAEARWSE